MVASLTPIDPGGGRGSNPPKCPLLLLARATRTFGLLGSTAANRLILATLALVQLLVSTRPRQGPGKATLVGVATPFWISTVLWIATPFLDCNTFSGGCSLILSKSHHESGLCSRRLQTTLMAKRRPSQILGAPKPIRDFFEMWVCVI